MSGILDTVKQWLGLRARDAGEVAEGSEPATLGPPGTDEERETSTNAQVAGAADEPYPDA